MKTKRHRQITEKKLKEQQIQDPDQEPIQESPQDPIQESPQDPVYTPSPPPKKNPAKPIAVVTELHPETDFLTELNTNYTQAINYSAFIKHFKFDSYKFVLSMLDIKYLFCNKWIKINEIIYTLFVNILLAIPYEKRPIHIFKTPESYTADIWYIKENNIWYQLNGVDPNDPIKIAHEYTSEVYYLIIKPMLLKIKNAWLNHASNLYVVIKPNIAEKPKTPENLKEKRFTYALCGQILCKYDTIFEYMHPRIPASIKDILIKS